MRNLNLDCYEYIDIYQKDKDWEEYNFEVRLKFKTEKYKDGVRINGYYLNNLEEVMNSAECIDKYFEEFINYNQIYVPPSCG